MGENLPRGEEYRNILTRTYHIEDMNIGTYNERGIPENVSERNA